MVLVEALLEMVALVVAQAKATLVVVFVVALEMVLGEFLLALYLLMTLF